MDLFFGWNVNAPEDYEKRCSFKKFDIYTKTLNTGKEHYYDAIIGEELYIIFGDLYTNRGGEAAEICQKAYMKGGIDEVFNLDGDFIFIRLKNENNYEILQSNYGGANLYYRIDNHECCFCTEASVLMRDFSEDDIDEGAVSDYLLFGSMIGGNTFSKRVKALVRGGLLEMKNGKLTVDCKYIMKFDANYTDVGFDEVVNRLADAYLGAVEKRTRGRIGNSAMFLSGGKDSRLLLSSFSHLYDEKIHCISFGQLCSDETHVASDVAAINNNPYHHILLRPADFITYAEEYVRISAGMDWFPQSYILSVLNQVPSFSDCYAGSFLTDIVFHGKYSDPLKNYKGDFSSFIKENHNIARMNGFEPDELNDICYSGIKLANLNHMIEDVGKYKGDAFSYYLGYMNITNGANQISFRTDVFPNKFMDTYDPSQDKKFVREICSLPLEYILTDDLHVKLIEKINPEYLCPLYSDYRIPMQSSRQEKKLAIEIEKKREELFIEMMKHWNNSHEFKFYYSHDYADFEGYMKYDKTWIDYLDRMLLDTNSFIYKKYFDCVKVSNMISDHRNNKKNYKKQLILLASLEQFFRIYLK